MAVELSVAIIFKNEIRCLERCMKSLQPLRERLSCEIVMADTGSTDGSRAIAERYADVVFDFPWVNDFAAARNAVIDRCSGKWILTLDCDEWLDEKTPAALEKLFKGSAAPILNCAQVRVRNYSTEKFDRYMDCYILRLFKRSRNVRYAGAIHETLEWTGKDELNITIVHDVLLLHDGYVMLNDGSEEGIKKRERNRALLREELKREPDSLITHIRFLESGRDAENKEEIRTAHKIVELIERRAADWDLLGPSAMARVVELAREENLPEFAQWAEKAQKLFPKAYMTRIDVNYQQLFRAVDEADDERIVKHAEAYLKAREDAETDLRFKQEASLGVAKHNIPYFEQFVRIVLADAYHRLGRDGEIVPVLEKLEWNVLDPDRVAQVLILLGKLCGEGTADGSALLPEFWRGACDEAAADQRAEQRKQAFLAAGECLFDGEKGEWRILLPLRGQCVSGDAAALMACESPEEADALLAEISDLLPLPAPAFIHALKLGAAFPTPERLLTVEEMDTLAQKLSADAPFLREALTFAASAAETEQDLLWTRSLALVTMQNSDEWIGSDGAFGLLCAFVRAESAFLPWCYAQSALNDPAFLPQMHRFALHLANAFAVISPSALAPQFRPTVSVDIRTALNELRLAAEAAPERKAVIDLILNTITGTDGSAQ